MSKEAIRELNCTGTLRSNLASFDEGTQEKIKTTIREPRCSPNSGGCSDTRFIFIPIVFIFTFIAIIYLIKNYKKHHKQNRHITLVIVAVISILIFYYFSTMLPLRYMIENDKIPAYLGTFGDFISPLAIAVAFYTFIIDKEEHRHSENEKVIAVSVDRILEKINDSFELIIKNLSKDFYKDAVDLFRLKHPNHDGGKIDEDPFFSTILKNETRKVIEEISFLLDESVARLNSTMTDVMLDSLVEDFEDSYLGKMPALENTLISCSTVERRLINLKEKALDRKNLSLISILENKEQIIKLEKQIEETKYALEYWVKRFEKEVDGTKEDYIKNKLCVSQKVKNR